LVEKINLNLLKTRRRYGQKGLLHPFALFALQCTA